MLYIFHSFDYRQAFDNALSKSKEISKKTFIMNKDTIEYKKNDIENFLYFFLLESSIPITLIIEHPEKFHILTIQSFLQLFENIPKNHTIILVTKFLHLLPKTIISRSLLFTDNYKNKISGNEPFNNFLNIFSKNIIEDLNELIDSYNINENNTKETTLLILKKFPNKEKEIMKALEEYNSFIHNGHYHYWKIIYTIIHTQ